MPVEFTLEQLARIALGVPQLSRVNLAVLHSLMDLLLKKLDCKHDLVSIGGIDSKCMEHILQQSKISPLPFQDETIVPVTEEFNKLKQMEQRIAELEQKLQCHFEQARICNKLNEPKATARFWEKYSLPCEDLCTTCDEDNRIACALLGNMDFVKKLLRVIATPLLDELEDVRKKLETFYETLQQFLRRTEELYKRLELVKQCVIEIEKIRALVKEYNLLFIGTMEELQDMLDAKLDKVHMPALKKYIRDRFDDIELRLQVVETKEECPRAAGFIDTNIKCLSCGNTNVGVDVGPQIMSLMPDAVPHGGATVPFNCHKAIVCRSLEKEPTIIVRMQNLDFNVLTNRLTRTSNKVCKLPEANDTIYGLRSSKSKST